MGHNAVIILQLAIPRTNPRDVGQEPEAIEEVRQNILFCVRAAAAVSGVPRSCTHPGPRPRVTRIGASRHRQYEVPPSQHHHSIRAIHPYHSLALKSDLGLLAVLPNPDSVNWVH